MCENAAIAIYSENGGYDLICCEEHGELNSLGKYLFNVVNDYGKAKKFIGNGNINVVIDDNVMIIEKLDSEDSIIHYKSYKSVINDYCDSYMTHLYVLKKNNVWHYVNRDDINKIHTLKTVLGK